MKTKILLLFLSILTVFTIQATNNKNQEPTCIFVEGLVGSGKTTLIHLLKKHLPEATVIEEPLEKWLDVEGKGDLYDLFLKDTPRWAFTAEFYIPFIRAKTLEETVQTAKHPAIIIDRSMYMDRYCFAKTVHNMGAINDLEWEIYQQWFSWFMQHVSLKPAGFIYLQTDVQTTLNRIKARDRIEEKDYPVDLQKRFHQCFEDFFITKKALPQELSHVPILVLDATKNFKNDPSIQSQYIDQIKNFINQLSDKKTTKSTCNQEIEIKMQLDNQTLQEAKNWLDIHATFHGTIHHKEYYLNNPKNTFFFPSPEGHKKALNYLRVRFTEQNDSVCFKKFHIDPVEKRPLYCDEYELNISDGNKMLALLNALGYTEQTLMEKIRTTYTYDCFEIVIDHVKNLGTFMEIELKTEVENARVGIALIYDFLKSIGITKIKLYTCGYITMLWNPDIDFARIITL